jgi:hypothetical protein
MAGLRVGVEEEGDRTKTNGSAIADADHGFVSFKMIV